MPENEIEPTPDIEPTSARLQRIVREETGGLHPKLILLHLLELLLPKRGAARHRASLLRLVGFVIGIGTDVIAMPRITGSRAGDHGPDSRGLFTNLDVGRDVTIDREVVLDLEDKVTIGDGAHIGPQVMILTSTHDLGPREKRAGPVTRSPVVIGDGAWIGARSLILPGITIGAGAIVNPGAVVNKDVAPNTRVAGTPARKVELLEPGGNDSDSIAVA